MLSARLSHRLGLVAVLAALVGGLGVGSAGTAGTETAMTEPVVNGWPSDGDLPLVVSPETAPAYRAMDFHWT